MIAKLQPNRVRRTYLGGGRIDAYTGFTPPADGALRPEDWMASTTTAFNGTLEIEGEGLGRLEDGRLVKDVVGTLPILVKLLDSDERLVIQAHPTVPYAKAKLNSPVGKTECWYFLDCSPDACVYLGFKEGVTRESFQKAFWDFYRAQSSQSDSRTVEQLPNPLLPLLHRVPVKPGDFVFVDGGVPHAIGGGCFMIELQEPSDLMVVAERFTPSGREIPEKKLHCGLGFEEMFNVYEYVGYSYESLCAKYVRRAGSGGGAPAVAEGKGIVRILGPELTDKFSMYRLTDGAQLPLARPGAVAVVTSGAGTLNGLAVQKGDRLVVSSESELSLAGSATVVVCV